MVWIITLLHLNAGWAESALPGAIAKLEEVNALREALASTLEGHTGPITEETFQRVCAPAGKALKSWAESGGHKAQQLSHKFRNPAHEAKGEALNVLREFQKNKDRVFLVLREKQDGGDGWRVYRRIDVRAQCLKCHGDKASRPTFIKEKYPKDSAHGFAAGDLRGIYSVWVKAPGN